MKNHELNENKFLSLKNVFNKFELSPLALLPHYLHIDKVDDIMCKRKFEKLFRYGSFKVSHIHLDYIRQCDDVVLKHIIDNCDNLNDSFYLSPNLKFFTYVVAYHKNNFEIVKYLIEEKNVNLEEENIIKSTPIYYACQKSSFEVINLILDHNVRLGFKNDEYKTQSDYLKQNNILTNDQKKIIEDRIQSIIRSRIAQGE